MFESTLFILAMSLLFCVFLILRNEWVFIQRMIIADNNVNDYHKLWSYEKMFFHFWIWNIDQMMKD